MPRAEPSGIRLTEQDASIVKGMLARGDRQQDIAAWFGVNQARIVEINNGQVYPNITLSPQSQLPPVGPYSSGQTSYKAVRALLQVKEALGLANDPSEIKTAIDLAKEIVDSALDEIQKSNSPREAINTTAH